MRASSPKIAAAVAVLLGLLLSILVPVFNEARTVAEVLDRLTAIDLPCDREIVVVNDGSSDGTFDVLERYYTGQKVAESRSPQRRVRRRGTVSRGIQL